MRWLLFLGLCLMLLTWPPAVQAHVGAPYPVLLDEAVGPYTVSAVADPDVGTGTFYVLASLDGDVPVPEGTSVTLLVVPDDDHAAEAAYLAERQDTRYGERFVAKVPFDVEGKWQVRLVLDGTLGRGETSFSVRVTPSGIGWLATAGCLVPFVVLGILWWRGSQRQRSTKRG